MAKQSYGKFDFVGKRKVFAGISVVMVLLSLGLIFFKGLNYGIDFAGGTEVQILFTNEISIDDVRGAIAQTNLQGATIQRFGEDLEYLIRFQSDATKTAQEQNEENQRNVSEISTIFNQLYGSESFEVRRVDSVGPQIGSQMKRNGLLAVFYSLLLILIYVGLRFDYEYAPGAVFSLFHDTVITLGIFALIEHEINIQILAAVLTIIGYSLNDTIINFDRIRENREKEKGVPLDKVINLSINQILTRTILTSVTTLLAVGALFFFAGGVITDFAFVLGIGIVIGTYSSIYVAAPVILFIHNIKKS